MLTNGCLGPIPSLAMTLRPTESGPRGIGIMATWGLSSRPMGQPRVQAGQPNAVSRCWRGKDGEMLNVKVSVPSMSLTCLMTQALRAKCPGCSLTLMCYKCRLPGPLRKAKATRPPASPSSPGQQLCHSELLPSHSAPNMLAGPLHAKGEAPLSCCTPTATPSCLSSSSVLSSLLPSQLSGPQNLPSEPKTSGWPGF